MKLSETEQDILHHAEITAPAASSTKLLTWAVQGSHGVIIINAVTGDVFMRNNQLDENGERDDEYATIERFDVAEFRTWLMSINRPDAIEAADAGTYEIDILDIGYWNENESYEPAADDYRARWSE